MGITTIVSIPDVSERRLLSRLLIKKSPGPGDLGLWFVFKSHTIWGAGQNSAGRGESCEKRVFIVERPEAGATMACSGGGKMSKGKGTRSRGKSAKTSRSGRGRCRPQQQERTRSWCSAPLSTTSAARTKMCWSRSPPSARTR